MSFSTRSCPDCGGPLRLLGCLGHTRHYRCIDCGASSSHTPRRTAVKESRAVPAQAPVQQERHQYA